MEQFLQTYLDRDNSKDEFEIRFGENCTKMNYNNVIQWLLLSGFQIVNPDGLDLLRITVDSVKSRVELTGFDSVQTLCKDNTLTRPIYTTKTNIATFDGKKRDYGIRMSLSNEAPATVEVVNEITKTWLSSSKTFRYMNRIQLRKEGIPFVVDCSIVRMIRSQKNASMLFSSNLTYEIEAEFINSERSKFEKQNIAQIITFVLRGFQRTYYPVPYPILDKIKDEYIQLTHTESTKKSKFIGPNLVTLQLDSMYKNTDPNHVSIQQDFTVTDKADGERKLLFINSEGLVYLITSGLVFEFTGIKTKTAYSTLIDGEHIEYDKKGKYINTYMCFDLYLYQDKKKMVDVRDKSFIDLRLPKLKHLIENVLDGMNFTVYSSGFKLDVKTFYYKQDRDTRSIFDFCKLLLDKQDEFMYKTDGLIFTPSNYGVGLSKHVKEVKNYRDTWELNFKWKPVEDNTIDFYIRLKEYVPGMTHRTMWLYVGYSHDDVLASPCFSIFNANELGLHSRDNKIIFQTMEPYDENSYICNIDTETGIIHTEYGEVIEDEMVIECKYVKEAKSGWNWVPLRIRWDKMRQNTDLQGKSIMIRTPNSYTTAVSNWYTIHNPITHTMITTGFYDEKKTKEIIDTTYYNESKTGYMKELRDFHNKIKERLIDVHAKGQTSPIGRILIDFAVGKGGDLQKWKKSKFGFVFGIDITHDNINNKKNGACNRYMTSFSHNYKTRCLFLNGDSSRNIKTGNAFYTIPEKLISESIFGTIPRTPSLGKGIIDQYKKGADGFDIASIQFAVHYMFKSRETLSGFLQNVAECTKMNGYFIGTCFDGQRVLDKIGKTEYISYDADGNMICSIKKSISETRLQLTMDDCLGFTIEVNQSTIGKPIDEYLVYFPFFIEEMKRHGFKVIESDSIEGFSSGIGPFDNLYMDDYNMNTGQKNISFLNNYFIFKKVREISIFVEKLGRIRI